MPESLPRYHIDDATKKALLALREGHMASFYLYCDSSATKAGLSAVRATSAMSMTATEKGKALRKQMGASQFARGILFCQGPLQFTFVRYGGNLAKARMDFTLGVMYKRGGFDGRLTKGLRDAEVYDKGELDVPNEDGVTPLTLLLSATEAPDPSDGLDLSGDTAAPTSSDDSVAPVVPETEPSPVGPSLSKAELLLAMEADFLNEDALEEEMLEVVLEGAAPLLAYFGLDVSQTEDLGTFADEVLTAIEGITPEMVEALLMTDEAKELDRMVRETLASAPPMREAGDDPISKLTAKVGQVIGGPLRASLDGAPPHPVELATRVVDVGYSHSSVRLLAATVVEDGAPHPGGGTVRHIKRAHVRPFDDMLTGLAELLEELMEDETGEPEDLLEELEDGIDDVTSDLDRALTELAATPVAVIDDVALSDLQEALAGIDEHLAAEAGYRELLKLKAETGLQGVELTKLYHMGAHYRLRFTDEDVSDKFHVFRGDPRPFVVLPGSVLQREVLEPVARLLDLERRQRAPGGDAMGAELARVRDQLHDALAGFNDWKAGSLILRTAQRASLQGALDDFGQAALRHTRAVADGLPEYGEERALVATALAGADTPTDLGDLWPDAVASAQGALIPTADGEYMRTFQLRVPRAPYPALLWAEGTAHAARWTSDAEQALAEARGYGPVLTARYIQCSSAFYVDLPGGGKTLAALIPVLSAAEYKNVYLVSDPKTVAETFDVMAKRTKVGKTKKVRRAFGGSELTKKDVKAIQGVFDTLTPEVASSIVTDSMVGFPKDLTDYTALGAAYAKGFDVDVKTDKHKDMALEALLDMDTTRDTLIQGIRMCFAIESLLFYVAVTRSMARHRLLFPELLPMLQHSGADRVTWIHQNFIQPGSTFSINIKGANRTTALERFTQGTFSASPEEEYAAITLDVRGPIKDAMRRILAFPSKSTF